MFYSRPNTVVFEAAAALFDAGGAPEIVAVHAALVRSRKDRECGGMAYLEKLVAEAESARPDKARAWAASIRETFARRQLIGVAKHIEIMARDGDVAPADAVREGAAKLEEAGRASGGGAQLISMKQAVTTGLRAAIAGHVDLVPTGIPAIDEILGGFHGRETTVLAAATSIGKSVLAAQISCNIAEPSRKLGVLYVTLEMPAESFGKRVAAARAHVHHKKIRQGTLTMSDASALGAAAGEVSAMNLEFLDVLPQTIVAIDAAAKSLAAKWREAGIRLFLIVVDTMGKVKATHDAKKDGRGSELAETARGLEWLAQSNAAHVLGVHHINREASKREGKSRLPKITDLRDSGEIENAAHNVLLIHRDRDHQGLFVEGQPAALIVGKSRNDDIGARLMTVSKGWAEFGVCNEDVGDYYR
jgi:replicative DNA helicase